MKLIQKSSRWEAKLNKGFVKGRFQHRRVTERGWLNPHVS